MTRLVESSLILPEKYRKNKDLDSLTQAFKLLIWIPNNIKTYSTVTLWLNACLQFDLK